MVDRDYVQEQLKKINFGSGWLNRSEVAELENILLDDEQIYECVNGYYESGVALLVASDVRVLLIDKKPMGFLNVDDLRFDMISDIDYSHRLFGAQIKINCGMKNLVFKSYNQPRLRKLISHVQQRMSEIKREANTHATEQKQHLEDINKQLQMYLLAQQQQLEKQIKDNQKIEIVKPTPKLADYLFAQRLLENFHKENSNLPEDVVTTPEVKPEASIYIGRSDNSQQLIDEMIQAGRKEVFGRRDKLNQTNYANKPEIQQADYSRGFEVSPMKIAYAKLPYLLRTRRYRPKIVTTDAL